MFVHALDRNQAFEARDTRLATDIDGRHASARDLGEQAVLTERRWHAHWPYRDRCGFAIRRHFFEL